MMPNVSVPFSMKLCRVQFRQDQGIEQTLHHGVGAFDTRALKICMQLGTSTHNSMGQMNHCNGKAILLDHLGADKPTMAE